MEIKKHCKYKFSDQCNLIYRLSNEKTQSVNCQKKKKWTSLHCLQVFQKCVQYSEESAYQQECRNAGHKYGLHRVNRSMLWVSKSMISCTINVLHVIVLKLPDVIFYTLKREICFTFLNKSKERPACFKMTLLVLCLWTFSQTSIYICFSLIIFY